MSGGSARSDLFREVASIVEQSLAEPEAAAARALRLLLRQARAENGYFMLATKRGAPARRRTDAHDGFRVELHHRANAIDARASAIVDEILRSSSYLQDASTSPHTKRPGLWLARESELTPERSQHPDLVLLEEALDLRDQLVGAIPLGARARLHVGLDRRRGERAFSARDREAALEILPALALPFARLSAARGVIDDVALSPRESMVHRLLLGPYPEKEIAATMGLSTRGTHQLVLSVYRKLGVSSRVELFTRWQGRRDDGPREELPKPLRGRER
ncbi:MAG: response regulator transcription factor [Labilithrix sp.]|nr:response regulator transcription factor [Labilithrix sp.]MBX3212386.1 response regulator transcription factor [Labilithrix sp.]